MYIYIYIYIYIHVCVSLVYIVQEKGRFALTHSLTVVMEMLECMQYGRR